MRSSICCLVIGALLTATPALAERALEPRAFEARVDDVRLESRLLEQGKSKDDRVSVTVPAVIFEEPLRIDDVRSDDGGHGKLIDFLVRYWRANVAGDGEAVIAAWCPDSRERIRRFVGNEKLFERNQRALQERPGLTILGLVRHEDTTSILQDRGHTVTGLTLRTEGAPCLVPAPADDLELAVVEAALD
jgi:hypothetical protein